MYYSFFNPGSPNSHTPTLDFVQVRFHSKKGRSLQSACAKSPIRTHIHSLHMTPQCTQKNHPIATKDKKETWFHGIYIYTRICVKFKIPLCYMLSDVTWPLSVCVNIATNVGGTRSKREKKASSSSTCIQKAVIVIHTIFKRPLSSECLAR